MVERPRRLAPTGDVSIGIERDWPMFRQPKTTFAAWDKKVAIEACVPGHSPPRWYRDRGVNHPHLTPITIEDQADAIVECIKAGAMAIHTHPRDPATGMGADFLKWLPPIMDRAMEKVDLITAHHTNIRDENGNVDYITPTEKLLELGKGF